MYILVYKTSNIKTTTIQNENRISNSNVAKKLQTVFVYVYTYVVLKKYPRFNSDQLSYFHMAPIALKSVQPLLRITKELTYTQ